MDNVKNKMFIMFDIVSFMNWYNNLITKDENSKKRKEIPLKILWLLKKASSEFSKAFKDFTDFKDSIVKDLQSEYFCEEKSIEAKVPKVDEKGKPVLDSDGNEILETCRQVKPEYIDDYKLKISDINVKINELLLEKREFKIETFNMDSFVNSLKDDTVLEFEDLQIMCVIDNITNVIVKE